MSSVLFVGGRLWSPADWPAPQALELLVEEDRIVAIGDRLDGPTEVERVDLRGGTLLPAFGDGHAHPLQAGLEARFAPVRGNSLAAVIQGVVGWAIEHPESDWVYGGGFDLSLAEQGIFDARWLDAALSDRPVVLRANDYHTLWCNTEALRRSGIGSGTPEPIGGEIVRRADGSPNGTLREWGATDPVFAAMPKPALDLQVEAITSATRRCAAVGLSWVQDAWVEPDDVEVYLAAVRGDGLEVDVNLALRADPDGWPDQVAEFGGLRQRVDDVGSSTLTVRTVKFFVDGVIESGTASMLEPYLDCPHSSGLANWSRSELTAAVAAFSGAGFQVHLHAIGDSAVRDALDAVEHSVAIIGVHDLRPVIAHVQVVDPVDLGRFRRLGVIACFQPLWAQPDATQELLTVPRIGPERAALQYPIRALADAGTAMSFGSDWPVTELAPLSGLVTAVTRQTTAGVPPRGWYPEQRVDLRAAFAAYTRGVALQGFRDDAGLLAAGQRADLVWLDADLRGADPWLVRRARVVGTWRAGRRIH
jgi:predicted amidohydrolase YtcJ